MYGSIDARESDVVFILSRTTTPEQQKIKIKVCFCAQKRMFPPIPQTVVIGKKSIWVTNKINLQ
jgi:hypothetical protein